MAFPSHRGGGGGGFNHVQNDYRVTTAPCHLIELSSWHQQMISTYAVLWSWLCHHRTGRPAALPFFTSIHSARAKPWAPLDPHHQAAGKTFLLTFLPFLPLAPVLPTSLSLVICAAYFIHSFAVRPFYFASSFFQLCFVCRLVCLRLC